MKDLVRSMSFEYGDALFRLYQFQISPKESAYEHPVLHEHRFFELHFALEGDIAYSVGDKSIRLNKDCMLILPPDTPHMSVDPYADNYSFSVLSFSISRQKGEEGCFSYFERALNAAAQTPLKMTRSLSSLAKEMAEIPPDEPFRSPQSLCFYKAKASAFICELFELLSSFNETDKELRSLPDKGNILVLLEALVNQPGRTLSEIAEAIHYSTRQTSRLIHSVYGMSLSDVRKQQRSKGRNKND